MTQIRNSSLLVRLAQALATIFLIFDFCTCGMRTPQRSGDETTTENFSWRILVYGDAGDGDAGQRAVGKVMAQRHLAKPFDFALSVGDNQYVDGPDVFKKIFEIPYQELIGKGLRFYQTIGNHDMEKGRLPKQLQYSKDIDAVAKNVGGWAMPAEDYVVRHGATKFIVTNLANADLSLNLDEKRRSFLQTELCEEPALRKVLFLHYPFFSTGPHGDHRKLEEELLPLLERCPPLAVLSGHDHHAELFERRGATFFAVSGNGHEVRKLKRSSALKSRFRSEDVGFLELELHEGAELCFHFTQIPDIKNTQYLRHDEFCEKI